LLLSTRGKVTAAEFSPDGNFFAVAIEKHISVYETPNAQILIEPLTLITKFNPGHTRQITGFSWTGDSRFILSYAKDNSVRMRSIFKIKDFTPYSFVGHKTRIVEVFGLEDMSYVYSISKDGFFLMWKWVEDYVSEEYKNLRKFELFKGSEFFCLSDGLRQEAEDWIG
jgi:periodic tryptophan protein 2